MDNRNETLNFGRYIIGVTVEHHTASLTRRSKNKIRPLNRRYTSPNEIFQYNYPVINVRIDRCSFDEIRCLIEQDNSDLNGILLHNDDD